jgi:hypothetical protein
MATDKISFDVTVEQVNQLIKPVYSPLYSIFTKAVKYTEKIGQITFKRNDTIGDLDAKMLSAQGTERKHFVTGQSSKNFNKYLLGISYIESGYQEPTGIEKIAGRVIEYHSKQLDRMVFTGDPDATGALQNNGILNTNDPNAVTNDPYTLSNVSVNSLSKFFTGLLKQSEELTGNSSKTILLSGQLRDILTNFVDGTAVPYGKALADIYPVDANIIALPQNLNSIVEGNLAIVLSTEDITFNYIAFPQLEAQGYDARNQESWFNFYFGSAMVDLEINGALIKQPVANF